VTAVDHTVLYERDAYDVDEFCARHSISRAWRYQLWGRSEGPTYMQVGKRRLISREAAIEWRRRMEIRAA
jgi:hypothetical protein